MNVVTSFNKISLANTIKISIKKCQNNAADKRARLKAKNDNKRFNECFRITYDFD